MQQANRTRIQRAAKLATAVGIALLTMTASTGAASAAGWEMHDRNGDRRHDIAGLDNDRNGTFEVIWVDTDYDGDWDLYVGRTGRWRQMHSAEARFNIWTHVDGGAMSFVDADLNGRFERLTYDGNVDGTPEWVMLDHDRDGSYDGQWMKVPTYGSGASMIIGGGSRGTGNVVVNQLVMDHNNRMINTWLQ